MFAVNLTAQNIFDRAYQNHLNRLKEGGIYNMGRNIVMKVSVPISYTCVSLPLLLSLR